MVYSEDVIKECKRIQSKYSYFLHYNRPAKIVGFMAFVIPLGILFPTMPESANGESDFSDSPYAMHAGIIFLVCIGIAYYLRMLSHKFKTTIAQQSALHTFNTYEYVTNYLNKVEPDRNKASKEFTKLIVDIKSAHDIKEDKIKGFGFSMNPIEKLVMQLEQNILPAIRDGDANTLIGINEYLIKLTNFFLQPTDELIQELSTTKIALSSTELPTKPSISIGIRKLEWVKYLGMLGIFIFGAVTTYYLALYLQVDKGPAFQSSVAVFLSYFGFLYVITRK